MTFATHTPETAPPATRPALEAAQRHFGAIPAPLARLAESPTAVSMFNDALAHFARSSLDMLEREVVTFVVATTNECHYCVAMHSQMLGAKAPAATLEALRRAQPVPDVRLEALRQFTLAVLAARGDVSDAQLEAFLEAGFTRRQALDVVVGIATYTLSTFANRLTRAPLDAALEPFRWDPSR